MHQCQWHRSDQHSELQGCRQFAQSCRADRKLAFRSILDSCPYRLRDCPVNLVSEARIDLIQSQITRAEITDGKAVSQLTTDERRLDRKTGAQLLTYSPIHGACRRFEWAKIDGTWKIEREVVVQEELAAKLEAATSIRERDELLEREKVFVTNALILALSGRGFRYSARSDHETALRCADRMFFRFCAKVTEVPKQLHQHVMVEIVSFGSLGHTMRAKS